MSENLIHDGDVVWPVDRDAALARLALTDAELAALEKLRRCERHGEDDVWANDGSGGYIATAQVLLDWLTPTPDPFSDSTPLVCSTDPDDCEACQ